ncbi:MAG: trehalose utilization protein ThuA [Acidimicrobiaceae bacterium]|nr:trehalose utilization protein ThuA [Acidimicrobiaceae bacterium]
MTASAQPIRVTVWGENVHERQDRGVVELYPDGMHTVVAAGIAEHLGGRALVRTATLDQPGQGLPPEVLEETDVLTWWGHIAHDQVDDELVRRVCERVNRGMGLLMLHSGHYSKVFRTLMGTSCNLKWRSEGERELVWTVDPSHPITEGVPEVFAIDAQEMYCELFDIPPPDELVFISSFAGGEVFRSGCCFTRGRGRIFYFSPGDQEYPVYYHPVVRRILANGVTWAYRSDGVRPESYQSANAQPGWIDEVVRPASP